MIFLGEKNETGISQIFFHKIIHSLLALSVYKSQSSLKYIFRYKKCDIYLSIYGRYLIKYTCIKHLIFARLLFVFEHCFFSHSILNHAL